MAKIAVRNPNTPGRETNVDADRYAAMRTALLIVVPTAPPGITHAEMVSAVRPHLPESVFPGGQKVMWWSKTVQLDLEARGLLQRTASRPMRWWQATS
ncbi:MAG: hypothetical protein AAFO79_05060, partial [Pseudomonadota bacterium]